MPKIQQRDVNLANKLTPNNSSGRKARPRLGRLGRRLAENKQSVSELHANSEMQRNKRRNQTNLLSYLLLVYPITKSQRFLHQLSNPQPILNSKAAQSR